MIAIFSNIFWAFVFFVIFLLIMYLIREPFFRKRGLRIVWFSIITLLFFFYASSFIGIEGGTPQLPEHKNIVLEQKGVYAAYDHKEPVTFVKKPEKDGFALTFLNQKDTVILKPIYGDIPGKISHWLLKATVTSYPLRINNTAINFTDYNRLNYGSQLILINPNDSIRLSIKIDSLDEKYDNYIFRHFSGDVTAPVHVFSVDTVKFPKIKEGITLSRLFRKLEKEQKKRGISSPYNINTYPIDGLVKNSVLIARVSKGNTSSPLFVLQPIQSKYKLFKSYVFTGYDINNLDSLGHKQIIDTLLPTDHISLGYGTKTRFLKLSDETFEIYGGKDIAPIYFRYPKMIRLPDSSIRQPFLITSWKGFINYDYIFRIDIAGNKFPFFAKADILNGDKVRINTGENVKDYKINDNFYIDNGKEGVVFSFSKNKQTIRFFNIVNINALWATTLFILLFFIFLIITWWQNQSLNDRQSAIKLIWTFIILTLFFMAITRVIFSYRIASFPPENATFKELALFKKALDRSIWSMLIPVVLLLFINTSFFVKIYNEILKISKIVFKLFHFTIENIIIRFWRYIGRQKKLIILNIVTLSLIILLILGWVTKDNNQAAFYGQIRHNILTLIVTFAYLFIIVEFFHLIQQMHKLNKIVLFVALPFFAIISNFNDKGFLLLYITVGVVMFLYKLFYVDISSFKKSKGWRKFLFPIIIGGIALVYITVDNIPIPNFIQDQIYRIKADNPEFFLSKPFSENSRFDINLFKNNTYQMWQMKNYAANGGTNGVGYANAKIVNYGITYPTTLTDAFFSVFVLSEFGFLGGFTLIIFYFLILLLLIWLVTLLPEHLKKFGWLIVSIGFMLYFFTFYMALGNIGKIWFTGQNVPFFALYSLGDIIFVSFIFTLIGLIINLNNNNSTVKSNYINEFYKFHKDRFGEYRINKYYSFLVIILIMLPVILTTVFLNSIANDKKAGSDFSLPDEYVHKFKQKIRNDKIFTRGNTIEYLKSAHFTEFELAQIQAFNKRDSISKYNMNDGFLYLDREKRIRINKYYFKLPSPFKSSYIWKGQLYSSDSDKSVYQLNFLTSTASAGFGEKDSLNTILDPNKPEHYTGFKKYNMIDNEKKTIFEIYFDSITYIRPHERGENTVFLNGTDMKHRDTIILHENDIILIKKGNRKYYAFFNKMKNNLIARLSWVNGKYKRLFRYGEIFPMAYPLSKAADYAKISGNKDINITIDFGMQNQIQRIIHEFFNNYRVAEFSVRKENLHKAKNYSFTVIDTYTGEIKALGSWATYNPNSDKFHEYLYSLNPYQQSKVLKDPNLKGHLIGSTVKPLAYAAVQLIFNQQNRYDLAKLQVFHPSNSLTHNLTQKFLELDNHNDFFHPHYYLSGISFDPLSSDDKYEFWDCKDIKGDKWINHNEFISRSRNFYMLSLATFGLLKQNETIDNYLFLHDNNKHSRLKIKFDNKELYFDISRTNLLSRNTNTLSDLSRTYLFAGLDSLFNVTTTYDKYYDLDTISDSWHKNIKYYLPAFSDKRKNLFLKNVIPDPVIFYADRPENINYLEAFARGGGKNRWNNIQLCEAFSRISTGNYVHVNLERVQNDNDSISLPNGKWIQKNLVPPLHNVVTSGTAKALYNIAAKNHLYIIAKTGTLKEKGSRKPNSGMLMFTIGQYDQKRRQFIKGKTYTCYLYLEEGNKYKFPLAKKLAEYLASRINSTNNIPQYIPYEPLPETNERAPYNNTDEKRIINAVNDNNNYYLFSNYIDSITTSYKTKIEKICAVFDHTIKKWNYINDPNSYDYFAPASETIRNNFKGDCDDFAIFMATAVKYLGGTSRIGIGCDNRGCHAWAEVKIARNEKQLKRVKQTIINYYRNRGLSISENRIYTTRDKYGNFWMNLDWWGSKKHVGNIPFSADGKIKYIKGI